jgi:hypothetical protein
VKAALSILLSVLVLIATSGVAITKHYCGNRVASVSVLGDGGCTCGSMDENSNCCHSERAFFQVDDDFSVAPVQSLSIASNSLIALVACQIQFELDGESVSFSFLHYKPPIPDRDVLVLIQYFLI